MSNSYSISTQTGIQLAEGISAQTVSREAQALADQRNESVEYYEIGKDGPVDGTTTVVTPKSAKVRTITLSGRPPVKIREDEWPVIAHGSYDWYDGQVRVQANETISLNIRVRQYEDGRAIVYGTYAYDTNWQQREGRTVKVGALLDAGADIAAAIQDIGRQLHDAGIDEHTDDVVRECIADLPAQEL